MRRPVPFTVDGGVPPGNPDGEVDPVPDEGEPTPSPAPSPTDPDWSEQSCDPETEVCNVDPDRTYSWYQECTKPPSATCSSSGPGGYRREHVSVCADPAAKGYSWDKGPMAVGQVPDQEALMRACGFRNEFDYGWQYSCSDGGPVSCLGHNSYTGETRQFSDDTCLNAETPEWRSEALGWTGVGAKPNKDMMCNTQMGGFRTGDLMAKDTVSGDEEPYVCAYRAYRHVEVVCTYQGTQIDVSHPACIAKQKKFIKDQADYSPAEWRIVTPGVLEETRSLSDDPRMWDSCDWRYSHNVENPYCYAANLQDGEVYENEYSHCDETGCSNIESDLSMDSYSFQGYDSGGNCTGGMRMEDDVFVVPGARWVNLFGKNSASAGSLNAPRTYCYSGDNYSYATTRSCGALPNSEGYPNVGG